MILGLFLMVSLAVHAEEFGIASYYSDAFQGRKTASGELYNKNLKTAAHKTLPFGTIIRVTRLDNKTSVKVKINDRGPYIKGRIVDLSRAAAEDLDLIQAGHARVKIEVLNRGQEDLIAKSSPVPNLESLKSESKIKADAAAKAKAAKEKAEAAAKANRENIENPRPTTYSTESNKPVLPAVRNRSSGEPAPRAKAKPDPKPDLKVKGSSKAMEPKNIEVAASGTRVRGQDFKAYDLYKIQLMRPQKGGYGVQVASLTLYENVMKQVAELQEKWFNNILVSVEPGKNNTPVYKLILGPFPDRETAESYKKDLKKKKKMDGFVVDLSTIQN